MAAKISIKKNLDISLYCTVQYMEKQIFVALSQSFVRPRVTAPHLQYLKVAQTQEKSVASGGDELVRFLALLEKHLASGTGNVSTASHVLLPTNAVTSLEKLRD